jgi:hypothetical protein
MPSLSNHPRQPMSAYQGATGVLLTRMSKATLALNRLACRSANRYTRTIERGNGCSDLRSGRRLMSAKPTQFERLAFVTFARSRNCRPSHTPIRGGSCILRPAKHCCSRICLPRSQPLSVASMWKKSASTANQARATSTSSGTRTKRWISWASISSFGIRLGQQ